jgi:hypothetical protein
MRSHFDGRAASEMPGVPSLRCVRLGGRTVCYCLYAYLLPGFPPKPCPDRLILPAGIHPCPDTHILECMCLSRSSNQPDVAGRMEFFLNSSFHGDYLGGGCWRRGGQLHRVQSGAWSRSWIGVFEQLVFHSHLHCMPVRCYVVGVVQFSAMFSCLSHGRCVLQVKSKTFLRTPFGAKNGSHRRQVLQLSLHSDG